MQAFLQVAETGSFAAAARALGLSNSVVTKRVQDLEDFLGVQLLTRTTRLVSLTEPGETYMASARRILDELTEAEAELRTRTEKPVGDIHISAPLSFALQYLAPALASYLKTYPDVRIRTHLSDRRVDIAQEGFDLAIRVGALEDSSLIARKLGRARRVVCATPGYYAAHGKPRRPSDLKDHNCLGYANLADGKRWPFRDKGRKVWQPVSGNFMSDNGDMLLQAALSHCGIALLPTFIAGEALRDGRLQTALEKYEEPDFDVHAVYPQARHVSTKIRTLVDHLSTCFSGGVI